MNPTKPESPTTTDALRTAVAALAVGIVLTVTAGCGSSTATKVDKASFITKADAICARYEPRIHTIPQPSFDPSLATDTDMPAAVGYLTQTLPIARAESQALHALGEPTQDAGTFTQGLADFDSTISHRAEGLAAAQAGNVPMFRAAIAAEQSAGMKGSALLQQFGLQVCGTRPK